MDDSLQALVTTSTATGISTVVTNSMINAMAQCLIAGVPEEEKIAFPAEESLSEGNYYRTIYVPKDIVLIGKVTQVPTALIVHGDCQLRVHDSIQELRGFNIIHEPAGMMRCTRTYTDCVFTTVNRTDAKSIEEARAEFLGEDL